MTEGGAGADRAVAGGSKAGGTKATKSGSGKRPKVTNWPKASDFLGLDVSTDEEEKKISRQLLSAGRRRTYRRGLRALRRR